MFRIYDKSMNDEEILALAELWLEMENKLWIECAGCACENCKYNRLCQATSRTYEYIQKVLKERNLATN